MEFKSQQDSLSWGGKKNFLSFRFQIGGEWPGVFIGRLIWSACLTSGIKICLQLVWVVRLIFIQLSHLGGEWMPPCKKCGCLSKRCGRVCPGFLYRVFVSLGWCIWNSSASLWKCWCLFRLAESWQRWADACGHLRLWMGSWQPSGPRILLSVTHHQRFKNRLVRVKSR